MQHHFLKVKIIVEKYVLPEIAVGSITYDGMKNLVEVFAYLMHAARDGINFEQAESGGWKVRQHFRWRLDDFQNFIMGKCPLDFVIDVN